MNDYVVLLRGINVGGKNKLPMAELRQRLEVFGFTEVMTYIQSGNVLVRTELDAAGVGRTIETMLSKEFTLDSSIIKTLVLTHRQLQDIVDTRPSGFGDQPDVYHSDIVYLMGIDIHLALAAFNPREGVDSIWPGNGVIYSQRLSALRTKSRLSSIVGTPAYQLMTIRNWNTTIKLLQLLTDRTKG